MEFVPHSLALTCPSCSVCFVTFINSRELHMISISYYYMCITTSSCRNVKLATLLFRVSQFVCSTGPTFSESFVTTTVITDLPQLLFFKFALVSDVATLNWLEHMVATFFKLSSMKHRNSRHFHHYSIVTSDRCNKEQKLCYIYIYV